MVISSLDFKISSVGKWREKFGLETIQEILFEILSMKYFVELNRIQMRISNTASSNQDMHYQELLLNHY